MKELLSYYLSLPRQKSCLICPQCGKSGGLYRKPVKKTRQLPNKEDINTLSKAWDYAAEMCFRLHGNALDYPPLASEDDSFANVWYRLFTKLCPHTGNEIAEFKARQFSRLETQRKNHITTLGNFRPLRKKRISQVTRDSYEPPDPQPIHTELADNAGIITQTAIALLYGSIVFSALSELDKVRSVFHKPPEQIERELAYSVYVFFRTFRANIDKRFLRSLLQWIDLLGFEDHGYHAAESKKYGLAPLCKHCSDKKNEVFVKMSMDGDNPSIWRCNKCGGNEMMETKFTAKNIKKRRFAVEEEMLEFINYAPKFERYIQRYYDLIRKDPGFETLITEKFQECEIEANKPNHRKYHYYFMKHYDPTKKSKIRWCPLSRKNVSKISIIGDEYNNLLHKINELILDNNRKFEELRNTWFQYFNKLIELGFQKDVVFQKIAQDFIQIWSR